MDEKMLIPGFLDANSHELPNRGDFPLNTSQSGEAKDPIAIGGDRAKRKAEPNLESMSFEERIDFLRSVVMQSPLQREISYKTLGYCAERRTLSEIEEFIASCPEFPSSEQSPYFLLRFLLKGGGIDTFELDINGTIVTSDEKEGLTVDELDDLVEQYAYETNEVGKELHRLMSPKNRLRDLLEEIPAFYDTYVEVLSFVKEKRSLADIDRLLRGRDILAEGRDSEEPLLQPSVFIDKLEKAAAIVWIDGWTITPEAGEFLEALEERRALGS